MSILHFPLSPFEGSSYVVDFTCDCGSKTLIHHDKNSISFLEGYFMCPQCGTSVLDGAQLVYYHERFVIKEKKYIQLSLFDFD